MILKMSTIISRSKVEKNNIQISHFVIRTDKVLSPYFAFGGFRGNIEENTGLFETSWEVAVRNMKRNMYNPEEVTYVCTGDMIKTGKNGTVNYDFFKRGTELFYVYGLRDKPLTMNIPGVNLLEGTVGGFFGISANKNARKDYYDSYLNQVTNQIDVLVTNEAPFYTDALETISNIATPYVHFYNSSILEDVMHESTNTLYINCYARCVLLVPQNDNRIFPSFSVI